MLLIAQFDWLCKMIAELLKWPITPAAFISTAKSANHDLLAVTDCKNNGVLHARSWFVGVKSNIIYFSDSSWMKFLTGCSSVEMYWNERSWNIPRIKSLNLELVIAPERLAMIPHSIGYNHRCCTCYTDKTKIDRVNKKKQESGNMKFYS